LTSTAQLSDRFVGMRAFSQQPRNKKQLAKKVVKGSAKVPLKSAVFLVTKTGEPQRPAPPSTAVAIALLVAVVVLNLLRCGAGGSGKFVFKLPAQVAYRGTRGAYRKMKSRRRVGRGMIFSEVGGHHVVEGPLHKWVNYLRGWRKRWFILEAPGLLAYYSNHKKKTCLGTIPLSDAVVTISRRSPLRFVVDTDYGIFYLRATSAEQRDQWIHGIKDSQLLHEYQQSNDPTVSEGEEGMRRAHVLDRDLGGGGYDDYDIDDDDEDDGYGYGYGNAPARADTSELDEVRLDTHCVAYRVAAADAAFCSRLAPCWQHR
jgi:hypothetical protein